MIKNITFKVRGMQKDLGTSAFNPEFAYDIKNMRIMSTEENTMLTLVNEKGNLETPIIVNSGEYTLSTPIGQAIINNQLILFLAKNSDILFDRILKLWFDGDTLKGKELYAGNLNFNVNNPIETLVVYENEQIQKVYWVDGLNQPRVINTAASDSVMNFYNDNSFDFVKKVRMNEDIIVTKQTISNGNFASGTIQYAFTYFNKYAQETNIFNITPLYYTTYEQRGGSPESKVGNAFKIQINDVDKSYDYLRIYSIQRTSIDGTPSIKKVVDLGITDLINGDDDVNLEYTDNGLNGETVDPTLLLYIGGEDIIANTLTQKDNTLFLGNITLNRKVINNDVKTYFNGKSVNFSTKSIFYNYPTGYYYNKYQLNENALNFKTFKYLEYYRFGVQFQHKTGKWSEPIWINDQQNTQKPLSHYTNGGNVQLPIATFNFNDNTLITNLVNDGYVKIRPVIVYPELHDRECIYQGVVNPTVFNVQDRANNTPYSQASWFFRPNSPFDLTTHQDSLDRQSGNSDSSNSRKGVTSINNNDFNTTRYGSYNEFRHYYPIPDNLQRNAEIQCITNPPSNPYLDSVATNSDKNSYIAYNKENYYIDQSIFTLNSPDIEFDDNLKNIDTSNLKFRITGIIPLTAFKSDIDIQTSTAQNSYRGLTNTLTPGFYKEEIGIANIERFGWRSINSGAFWLDSMSHLNGTGWLYLIGFVVYPWHRSGSLNNMRYNVDGTRSAMLDKKKLSNLRYSSNTIYLDQNKIWNAYVDGNNNYEGISGVTIFDSNEVVMEKLKSQFGGWLFQNSENISYYGNVDKVIIPSNIGAKGDGYYIAATKAAIPNNISDITGSTIHDVYTPKSHYSYIANDRSFDNGLWEAGNDLSDSKANKGIDPVRMKYKSSTHAVIALNNLNNYDHTQKILPTIKDGDYSTSSKWSINTISTIPFDKKCFWEDERKTWGITQDVLDIDLKSLNGSIDGYNVDYGFLWLGELYNDNVTNRFGGQTEESFENNIWLPCGKSYSLLNKYGSHVSFVNLIWEDGDTYYQRYDCLKTYPFTLDDQNSVTEILSFMCETRVNLDGRYDKNRGNLSNLSTTPTNFNLMNPVYSQKDNYFTYRAINSNRLVLDVFNNTITWSLTKTLGELTDTWTDITLANTLDLDGDKGELRALRRFNNEILTFQDKAIGNILFNSRTQINTTDGVPIEIGNSGKVDGKRYLTDRMGCVNKWSICETPEGLYFIDDITKSINLFNGKFDDLSDKLGFHSWINAKSLNTNIWNPSSFDSFITYYDKITSDVFFISKYDCLGYSEPLKQFTSFYSYESVPYYAVLGDKGIMISKDKIDNQYKVWLHNKGHYNKFFNQYEGFHVTYIANPDFQKDKIWNNVEYRSDNWDINNNLTNLTFNKLDIWNEYQSGHLDLSLIKDHPSNLKKKFRIWRTLLPRDISNNRDRIRNPWVYLKLTNDTQNYNKTILHDVSVYYHE